MRTWVAKFMGLNDDDDNNSSVETGALRRDDRQDDYTPVLSELEKKLARQLVENKVEFKRDVVHAELDRRLTGVFQEFTKKLPRGKRSSGEVTEQEDWKARANQTAREYYRELRKIPVLTEEEWSSKQQQPDPVSPLKKPKRDVADTKETLPAPAPASAPAIVSPAPAPAPAPAIGSKSPGGRTTLLVGRRKIVPQSQPPDITKLPGGTTLVRVHGKPDAAEPMADVPAPAPVIVLPSIAEEKEMRPVPVSQQQQQQQQPVPVTRVLPTPVLIPESENKIRQSKPKPLSLLRRRGGLGKYSPTARSKAAAKPVPATPPRMEEEEQDESTIIDPDQPLYITRNTLNLFEHFDEYMKIKEGHPTPPRKQRASKPKPKTSEEKEDEEEEEEEEEDIELLKELIDDSELASEEKARFKPANFESIHNFMDREIEEYVAYSKTQEALFTEKKGKRVERPAMIPPELLLLSNRGRLIASMTKLDPVEANTGYGKPGESDETYYAALIFRKSQLWQESDSKIRDLSTFIFNDTLNEQKAHNDDPVNKDNQVDLPRSAILLNQLENFLVPKRYKLEDKDPSRKKRIMIWPRWIEEKIVFFANERLAKYMKVLEKYYQLQDSGKTYEEVEHMRENELAIIQATYPKSEEALLLLRKETKSDQPAAAVEPPGEDLAAVAAAAAVPSKKKQRDPDYSPSDDVKSLPTVLLAPRSPVPTPSVAEYERRQNVLVQHMLDVSKPSPLPEQVYTNVLPVPTTTTTDVKRTVPVGPPPSTDVKHTVPAKPASTTTTTTPQPAPVGGGGGGGASTPMITDVPLPPPPSGGDDCEKQLAAARREIARLNIAINELTRYQNGIRAALTTERKELKDFLVLADTKVQNMDPDDVKRRDAIFDETVIRRLKGKRDALEVRTDYYDVLQKTIETDTRQIIEDELKERKTDDVDYKRLQTELDAVKGDADNSTDARVRFLYQKAVLGSRHRRRSEPVESKSMDVERERVATGLESRIATLTDTVLKDDIKKDAVESDLSKIRDPIVATNARLEYLRDRAAAFVKFYQWHINVASKSPLVTELKNAGGLINVYDRILGTATDYANLKTDVDEAITILRRDYPLVMASDDIKRQLDAADLLIPAANQTRRQVGILQNIAFILQRTLIESIEVERQRKELETRLAANIDAAGKESKNSALVRATVENDKLKKDAAKQQKDREKEETKHRTEREKEETKHRTERENFDRLVKMWNRLNNFVHGLAEFQQRYNATFQAVQADIRTNVDLLVSSAVAFGPTGGPYVSREIVQQLLTTVSTYFGVLGSSASHESKFLSILHNNTTEVNEQKRIVAPADTLVLDNNGTVGQAYREFETNANAKLDETSRDYSTTLSNLIVDAKKSVDDEAKKARDADVGALQTELKNLQDQIKNPTAKTASVQRSALIRSNARLRMFARRTLAYAQYVRKINDGMYALLLDQPPGLLDPVVKYSFLTQQQRAETLETLDETDYLRAVTVSLQPQLQQLVRRALKNVTDKHKDELETYRKQLDVWRESESKSGDVLLQQAPAAVDVEGDIELSPVKESKTSPAGQVPPPPPLTPADLRPPPGRMDVKHAPASASDVRPRRAQPPPPPASIVKAIQDEKLPLIHLDLDIQKIWDAIYKTINKNLNGGESFEEDATANFRAFKYQALQKEFDRGQVERWLMTDLSERRMDTTTDQDEKDINDIVSAAEAGAKIQDSEFKELKRSVEEKLSKVRSSESKCVLELKEMKLQNKKYKEQLASLRLWSADLFSGWSAARDFLIGFDDVRKKWFSDLRNRVLTPLSNFVAAPLPQISLPELNRTMPVLAEYIAGMESLIPIIGGIKDELAPYETGKNPFDTRLQVAARAIRIREMERRADAGWSQEVVLETQAKEIETKITTECKEAARRAQEETRDLKSEKKKLEKKSEELQMRIVAADAFNYYARTLLQQYARASPEAEAAARPVSTTSIIASVGDVKSAPPPPPQVGGASSPNPIVAAILSYMPTFMDAEEVERKWAERTLAPTALLLDEKYQKQYFDTRNLYTTLEAKYRASLEIIKSEVKAKTRDFEDFKSVKRDSIKLEAQLKTAQTMINRLLQILFAAEQYIQPGTSTFTVVPNIVANLYNQAQQAQYQAIAASVQADEVKRSIFDVTNELAIKSDALLNANWRQIVEMYVSTMRQIANKASNLSTGEWKSETDQYLLISSLEEKTRKALQGMQKDYDKRIGVGESNVLKLAYELQAQFVEYVLESEKLSDRALTQLRDRFNAKFLTGDLLQEYTNSILDGVQDVKTEGKVVVRSHLTRLLGTLLDRLFKEVLPPTALLDPNEGFAYGDVFNNMRDILRQFGDTFDKSEIKETDLSTIRALVSAERAARSDAIRARSEAKELVGEKKDNQACQIALANLRALILRQAREFLSGSDAQVYAAMLKDLKEGKSMDKMIGEVFLQINKRLNARGVGGGPSGGPGGGGLVERPATLGSSISWSFGPYDTFISFFKLVTGQAASDIAEFVNYSLLSYDDLGRQRRPRRSQRREDLLSVLTATGVGGGGDVKSAPAAGESYTNLEDAENDVDEEKRHDELLKEIKTDFKLVGDNEFICKQHLTSNGYSALRAVLQVLGNSKLYKDTPVITMMSSKAIQLQFAQMVACEYKLNQILQGSSRYDTNLEKRSVALLEKNNSASSFLHKDVSRIPAYSNARIRSDGYLGTQTTVLSWNTELWIAR